MCAVSKNIGESINILEKKKEIAEQLINENLTKTEESLECKNKIKESFNIIDKLEEEIELIKNKVADI